MNSGLKNGWLEKRGKQLKKMHRRFFMLLRTGELWSCKDEYGKGMKVKLRLKKDRGHVHLVPRDADDDPYDFVVEDDVGREAYLRASRAKDLQSWITALNGLIDGRDLDEIASLVGSGGGGKGGGSKGSGGGGSGGGGATPEYQTATALGVRGGRVGSGTLGSNLTASELQVLRGAQAERANLGPAVDEFGGAASAALAGLTMSQLESKADWKPLVQKAVGLKKLDLHASVQRLSPLWVQSEKTRQSLQLMGDSLFGDGAPEPFTLVADASATVLLRHSFSILERLSPAGRSDDDPDELDEIFKTRVVLDSLEDRMTAPGAKCVLYVVRPHWAEPGAQADSGDLLLEDFGHDQPFAAEKVAVLFLAPASLDLLDKLSRRGVFRARLMCPPCVLPARHLCFESQAITMNMDTALEDLYSSSGPGGGGGSAGGGNPFDVADELVRGLVSMCAQLNEWPYIRYATSSINCGMLAGKFYEALHEFIQKETEFDFHGSVDLHNRSTVLLLDRNCDLKQPLLHDPCLQPCAFDYLGPQHIANAYQLELNERNPEWALYRHNSVLRAWENVQNRLVNSIYQDDEQKHRLTCIGKICVEIFDRIGDSDSSQKAAYDQLGNVLMLEQTMVTGVEWRGPPDQPRITAKAMDQSSVSDEFLTVASSEDTLTRKRLLALFLLTYPDISESVAARVISCVSLSDRIAAIENLRQIPKPIAIFARPVDPAEQTKTEVQAAMRCVNKEDAFDRNYPTIVDLANLLVTKKLSDEEYPYVRDPPPSPPASASATVSLRRSRSVLSGGASPLAKTKGARLFVVVLGGATYTELRHIYEQSRQTGRQIVLVSTHFMTAREYLDSLARVTLD